MIKPLHNELKRKVEISSRIFFARRYAQKNSQMNAEEGKNQRKSAKTIRENQREILFFSQLHAGKRKYQRN